MILDLHWFQFYIVKVTKREASAQENKSCSSKDNRTVVCKYGPC